MAGQFALADSTTDIVDALVSKGVLTEEEGKLISKGHETKKEKTLEGKFKDGFVIENSDGSNSMKIGGRLHMDYRSFTGNATDKNSSSGSLANGANESDTFDVRRARVELSGIYRKYYDYLLSVDLAGGNSGGANTSTNIANIVDQAYINFKWIPKAQVRVGQFKSPMNLEKMTSSNNVDFQERSVVNQLAPNEDRGIMVWGEPFNGFTYQGAITTGEGAKNRNDVVARVDDVEFVGRLTANFAQLMDNKDMVLHAGVAGSTTSFDRTAPNGWFSGTSALRTEQRGVNILTLPTGISIAGDNSIDRQRVGLEGVIAYGPIKLQSEYLKNNFSGQGTTTTTFDKDVNSYYVEALYMITGEKYADFYKGGAFGSIKPKNEFNIDTGNGYGAWEIGGRYSKVEAHDFADWVGSGTSAFTQTTASGLTATAAATAGTYVNTLGAKTYTVGLKWVPNNNTRILLNYVDTKFDSNLTLGDLVTNKERAITTRVQFMF